MHISGRVMRHIKRLAGGATRPLLSSRSPRLLLVLSAILVIVAILGTGMHRQLKNTTSPTRLSAENKTRLDSVTGLIKQASLAESTNPDQARDLLDQAIQALHTLAPSKNEAAMAMQAEAEAQLAKLNNITYIDPKNTESLDKNTVGIAVIGQYLFSVQASSGSLFRQTLGQKEPAQAIYTQPNTTLIYLGMIEETRQLVVVSANNKIYRVSIDNTPGGVELLPPDNEAWPQVVSITWYQSNMYILEKGSGQIWKYSARDSNHYATKQSYLVSASLIDKSAKAIGSDGNMYVLYSNGRVAKMLKGAPQAFGPFTIPKPTNALINPQALFTNIAAPNLYIQDQNRLIELTKDGQFVHQFVLRDGTIRFSFVSPKNKHAWLVVNNTLLETGL